MDTTWRTPELQKAADAKFFYLFAVHKRKPANEINHLLSRFAWVKFYLYSDLFIYLVKIICLNC